MSEPSTAPVSPLSISAIHPLLSQSPSSPRLTEWLISLLPSSSNSSSSTLPTPTIKSYPEASYHTYLPLGLDLIYSPTSPSPTPATAETQLQLDRIDIYNPIPGVAPPVAGSSRRRPPPIYTPPKLPLVIQLARTPVKPPQPPAEPSSIPTNPNQAKERPTPTAPAEQSEATVESKGRSDPFLITSETTGRDFVAGLGEPSRKGGAQGWVGPWLEWSDLRTLVRSQGKGVETKIGKTAKGEDDGDTMEEVGSVDQEWEEVGIGLMVELRQTYREPTEEEMKKGLGGVWDQAASWGWGCVKIFRVGSTI